MAIKFSKYEFYKQKLRFWGYIISGQGIKINKDCIEAITKWSTPTSIKEVERFLGFGNFYWRFINNYSGQTAPVHKLTISKTKFSWTKEAEELFNLLKTSFTSPLVMNYYNPNESAIIETDVLDFTISAVLSQRNKENKLHLVAYFSKKLTPQELSFSESVK